MFLSSVATTHHIRRKTSSKRTYFLRQNQHGGCFHARLQDQVKHKCILLQDDRGILINLPLKARDAQKQPRSSCSTLPALSFFQISLLISPLRISHLTVCLTVSSSLSALPTSISPCLFSYLPDCVPVYLLIIRQNPLAAV